MFIICFGVSVSPSPTTGEAQAPTAEQIPRCHRGRAQQRTLATCSNIAACFSMFRGLQTGNWPCRTQSHLRRKAAQEPEVQGCPAKQKGVRCSPAWSSLGLLLLTPPTLIASSSCGDQGTEGRRSEGF